jgi:uncharacterized repeat protein (TIGR03803 family)
MNRDNRTERPWRILRGACVAILLAAASVSAQAQTFSSIYQLPNTGGEGSDPHQMALTQGTDGNFYGTTFSGGVQGTSCCGTIFKVSPAGQFSTLWLFCSQNNCPDGSHPDGGVVQASDGNFYGTTYSGGQYDDGTIYRITPQGALTTLHSFCHSPNTCSPDDGAGPNGALIEASNGALYGTTISGTAFKISLKGQFKLLYTWPPGNGSNGALLQVGTGDLYGTTTVYGAQAQGSVFKMTLKGKVTTLYSFDSQPNCADGQTPDAGLTLGTDGALYGTTEGGGDTGCGGYGTVFRITTKGALTTLASFEGTSNGANPTAPLVLGTDGNLYGTTLNGGHSNGNSNSGVIFQISNGTMSNVYPLTGTDNCIGGHPYGGLMQSTNGAFYGTDEGACGGAGTVFAFDMGLSPFVTTIPAYGKAGAEIVIQGSNLTGTTGVTFNGTAAKFKVLSATEITAKVPDGATSGEVHVVTPGGTLASNVNFKILP